MISDLDGVTGDMVDVLEDLICDLVGVLEDLISVLEGLIGVLEGLIGVVEDFIGTLGDLVSVLESLIGVLGDFVGVLLLLPNLLAPNKLRNLVGVLEIVCNVLEDLMGVLDNIMGGVLEDVPVVGVLAYSGEAVGGVLQHVLVGVLEGSIGNLIDSSDPLASKRVLLKVAGVLLGSGGVLVSDLPTSARVAATVSCSEAGDKLRGVLVKDFVGVTHVMSILVGLSSVLMVLVGVFVLTNTLCCSMSGCMRLGISGSSLSAP